MGTITGRDPNDNSNKSQAYFEGSKTHLFGTKNRGKVDKEEEITSWRSAATDRGRDRRIRPRPIHQVILIFQFGKMPNTFKKEIKEIITELS